MFKSIKTLLSNSFYRITTILTVLLVMGLIGWWTTDLFRPPETGKSLSSTYEPPPKAERKADRAEYFHRMLQDPNTGDIPQNVRSRELSYAKTLPDRNTVKLKNNLDLTWSAIGPNNVGGRTRALGIDVTDSDVLIAGGVSGGIWKTTDGGSSWQLQTDPKLHQSVTSLAQDPRSGHTDTWYFTTGELFSGSASDRGVRAPYYGTGVFKSTDNGETWQQLQDTEDENTTYDSPFDFISRVRVNPQTGSVFIASNGFGIFRSTDGETFEDNALLGGPGYHFFADIDIAQDGTIAAVLSGRDAGTRSTTNPGVFVSNNDGDSWTEVTPSGWPSDDNNSYERSIIEIAPSNTDIAYVYTYEGTGQGEGEDVLLYRVNLSTGASTDLSDNLPDYGGATGFVVTQGNYNMELAIHPNDEDFVILGGRNLWRSRDGFSTPINLPTSKDEHWIGGYTRSNGNNDNGFSSYSNHHPDQHIVLFDPDNPSTVWSGHDGGLSKTTDITAEPVSWTDMNNGYNVTQFYSVELPDTAGGDNRIMGGTQDNGNPFFRFGGPGGSTQSSDIAGGDGGYDFFTLDYAYQSLQNGVILRFGLWPDGGNIRSGEWAWVHPSAASGQLFIHPYSIDPNDQTVGYYPAGNDIWKNTKLDEISNTNSDGTTIGWGDSPTWQNVAPDHYNFTAIATSDTLPMHRMYVGASAPRDNDLTTDEHPLLYRIENAHNQNNTPTDISIDTSLTPQGGYLHDIAINPLDGDELIAVLSNYNVTSVFHSGDGGDSWTAIEGNLAANQDVTGPSVRSASILPVENGTIYSVGTSAGLYTTSSLDGSSTQWVLEAPDLIGYGITEALDQRVMDGLIAAGTHGRGIFIGSAQGSVFVDPPENSIPEKFALKPNYPNPFNPTTTIAYDLPNESRVTLSVYDIQGRLVRTLLDDKVQSAGSHKLDFNGSGLASGTYIYQIEAQPLSDNGDVFRKSRKMLMLK